LGGCCRRPPARPAPHVRHPSARAGRRPAGDPGAARSRLDHHDAALHPRRRRPPAGGLPRGASAGARRRLPGGEAVSCDIALVTWRELPELDPDDRPLAAALRQRGRRVAVVAWDDPGFDWAEARLVLLRNPWDYFHRAAEFLACAARVAA